MTDADFTVISLIVDRSGSMASIEKDAEGAINSFIENQKKEPGRCSISLTQFDYEVEPVYSLQNIQDVARYSLVPRGATALNDAIGMTVVSLGAQLADMTERERPGHVIVVIVTDGEENSSVRYRDPDQVKQIIERQTDTYGWEFVFLAAGQDAVLAGGRFGIRSGASLSFSGTAKSYNATMDSAGYYASSVRSGIKTSFTDEDRARAGES